MSDKSNSLKQPQGSLGKTIRNYKLELGMTVILIVLYIVLHAVTGTALGKGNVRADTGVCRKGRLCSHFDAPDEAP